MAQTTHLSNMFKLFSIAFTPHTADSVKVVVDGMLLDDVAQTWRALELPEEALQPFSEALESYRGRDAEEVLHELRTDWAHMFIGKKPRVTNTEGLWRFRAEGRDSVRMINRHTTAVADFMRECGVKRHPKYNDCIDYIENECDFASFLASEPDYLVELDKSPIDLLENFMYDHMLKWAPGFCEDVQAHAQILYYKGIAGLLGEFLKEF